VTRRLISLALIVWLLGFVWFGVSMPQPAEPERTDAIVVPTGSEGRIPRGLDLLGKGNAAKMLVSGVDVNVRPEEFAAEYDVPQRLMDCCITLGFKALDTRGNARETAEWMAENEFVSMRLVTADWHMRRAALELEGRLPADTRILRDAVHTQPSLSTLFLEYHKFLATWLAQTF
tara:strand:- start:511 stop:1035 length:525 start_codon:yes stop_codon:yes gene_type:complete